MSSRKTLPYAGRPMRLRRDMPVSICTNRPVNIRMSLPVNIPMDTAMNIRTDMPVSIRMNTAMNTLRTRRNCDPNGCALSFPDPCFCFFCFWSMYSGFRL